MDKKLTCKKCYKTFKTGSGLASHLRRSTQCDNLSDEDSDDEYIEIMFPELPKFDFNIMKKEDNFAMCIVAIRRSGKSTLLKYLYPLLAKLHDSVFFISNSSDAHIYSFIDKNMFPSLNDDMVKDIFKYQRRTKQANSMLLVFDDCVSGKTKDTEGCVQAYIRGRNRNISIITSTQYMKMINRASRNNSDLILIGNNPGELSRFIVENLLLHFIDYPKHMKKSPKYAKIAYCEAFLKHHTKDYNFIVINNIDHKVYTFKTPI